jgi:hypothetical protein
MKTLCRIDPHTYTGRVYSAPVDAGCQLNELGEYVCVFSLFIASDTAYIYAMSGEFNKAAYADIKRQLQQMGVRRVVWERHKNGKVMLKEVKI